MTRLSGSVTLHLVLLSKILEKQKYSKNYICLIIFKILDKQALQCLFSSKRAISFGMVSILKIFFGVNKDIEISSIPIFLPSIHLLSVLASP